MQHVIRITNGVPGNPAYQMKNPVNIEINAGEQWAIVGPNGGGKTMLVDMLTSAHRLKGKEPDYDFAPSTLPLASDNIKYVAFRDSYGTCDATYYYQQRWNQQEINENTPTVAQLLDETFQRTLKGVSDKEEIDRRTKFKESLYSLFRMESQLKKYIILLSSGELRKFQLIKTLLWHPRVLILDNPFIGLDAPTRDLLNNLLRTLSLQRDLTLVLVLSKTDDIPGFVTHVCTVEDRIVGEKQTLAEYLADKQPFPTHVLPENLKAEILGLPYKSDSTQPQKGEVILQFDHVRIQYDKRVILKDLDWTVRCGERWALSGENGAGKSTLLSLVCADNPQAYACPITLFGRRRGTGESIWDIKRHIGYVSPEMHRAYLKDVPAIEIVASGLHDSVGLYRKASPADRPLCLRWMRIFGIEDKADTTFLKLSSGEQRLVLLARAFVRDPELLILDEPLHGLDDLNRRRVKDIITAFCGRKDKTLIMVTHYEKELPPVIDHSLFLKRH